jgi:hypothetical protein
MVTVSPGPPSSNPNVVSHTALPVPKSSVCLSITTGAFVTILPNLPVFVASTPGMIPFPFDIKVSNGVAIALLVPAEVGLGAVVRGGQDVEVHGGSGNERVME